MSPLGLRPVINANATVTVLGGSLMPPPVVQAMADAAAHFVDLPELNRRVGERLADLTNNEAAYVTSGAAAAITLAVAACITTDSQSFPLTPDPKPQPPPLSAEPEGQAFASSAEPGARPLSSSAEPEAQASPSSAEPGARPFPSSVERGARAFSSSAEVVMFASQRNGYDYSARFLGV
ncbi:hypothetical protein, partial [Kribbella sp.]|uniref:hypothetical protein n=1 Tax=Kribbella sp. TaxID=1871183 RepID=UPI002D694E75|nr:hypothetical protein [Kribbella sp.]